jgi:hypothetical protein
MTDYQEMIDDQSDDPATPDEVYDMYWAPQITDENGGIDPVKLHQVLSDTHDELMNYGQVLDHTTYGTMSKPGYDLFEILSTIDEETAYYNKVDLLQTALSSADGAELSPEIRALLNAFGITDEDIDNEDVAR